MGILLLFATLAAALAAATLAAGITFLVGTLFGMKPDVVMLGNKCWLKIGDQWKKMTGGGALTFNVLINMTPPSGEWKGGQILTLFAALILTPLVIGVATISSFRRDPKVPLADDIAYVAGLGVAMGFFIATLVYLVTFLKAVCRPNFAQIYSDAARLALLARSPIRPREWDRAVVDRVLANATKDRNDLFRDIFAYTHYWDSGERERGLEILHGGKARTRGSHAIPGNTQEYWFELAYVQATHVRDLAAAQESFAKGAAIKGDFADSSRFRAEAAILLLQGDQTGAMSAIVKSKAALAKLYAPDDPRMQSNPEWLGELENQCMQPGEAGYFRS